MTRYSCRILQPDVRSVGAAPDSTMLNITADVVNPNSRASLTRMTWPSLRCSELHSPNVNRLSTRRQFAHRVERSVRKKSVNRLRYTEQGHESSTARIQHFDDRVCVPGILGSWKDGSLLARRPRSRLIRGLPSRVRHPSDDEQQAIRRLPDEAHLCLRPALIQAVRSILGPLRVPRGRPFYHVLQATADVPTLDAISVEVTSPN